MSTHRSHKAVWHNQFQSPRPSASQLRAGFDKPMQTVFDAVRETFLSMDGLSEAVAWHGVPWRWTLVYQCQEDRPRHALETSTTRAFAYLIPDPARLQVCLPLTGDQVVALPTGRLKKSSRDTIVFARTVAGVSWPTWTVDSRAAIEEFRALIEFKHAWVFGAPGLSAQASA